MRKGFHGQMSLGNILSLCPAYLSLENQRASKPIQGSKRPDGGLK